MGMGRHFPHSNLLENLHRYSKYATASYGSAFMTVFDVGKIRDLKHVKDSDGAGFSMNHVAFAVHVGVPVCDVLYSSSRSEEMGAGEGGNEMDKIDPVAHYISLDRDAGVVVITIRGTLSLSDLIIDLKFDYAHHRGHKIHAGILHTTTQLLEKEGAFMKEVRKALADNPGFGVVVVGHSLGGGVATLLAREWSVSSPLGHPTMFVTCETKSGLPGNRPIHVYSFGTPCIVDFELSTTLKGLVTTVIHGDDMIPTMSVGLVRDLKTVAFHLLDPVNKGLSERIIATTLGVQASGGKKISQEEEDFFFGVIS
ncbi:UNVERIFIED_CONTAM: hypothetical protein HDU68_011760, partial [Siphonaria sp. JEL0065]